MALIALLTGCARAQTPTNTASKISTRVLVIDGDWKTQAWYQDVWNQNKKLMRGRFIASQVEKAAPGKFVWTQLTSYEGAQYVDANYLSQFDIVLLGDVIGWTLPPRFMDGLKTFVQNGGGFAYLASWKWHTTLLDGSPLEEVLPARFGIDSTKDDWSRFNFRAQSTPFKAQVVDASHPIIQNLDWNNAPNLAAAFVIIPKQNAQTLLQTPSGAPILTAWELGKGRAVLSSSIFSNDELSGEFAQNWKDFGKFYTQLLGWLGANTSSENAPLKATTGDVEISIDAAKNLNSITAKNFGIHAAHDDPNLAPLQGKALDNYQKLNLSGAFARLRDDNFEPQNDNNDPNVFDWSKFHFGQIDAQMKEVRRLNLEPLFLVTGFRYGTPAWMNAGGANWQNPTDQYAAEIAEQCAAIVEHLNGGKGNSPNYKLNLKYLEVGNEPEMNGKTLDGFVQVFKAVATRIHRDYPGVKVGAGGSYELPFIYDFMQKAGDDLDWISRHPYGWTGEQIFQKQDEYAAWRKAKNLKPIEFIITEWDFWIQGKPKFDYMMRRYFEAVKRDNLAGTLHYRLGQYEEGGYLFGVLWAGWGREKSAGEKGDPMHDAYDALWMFRDFRGQRVSVAGSTPTAPGLNKHVLAAAAREGEKLNIVLYFDRGADGSGWKDFSRSVHYAKARVRLNVKIAPSKVARTISVSRADGAGFEIPSDKMPVPAATTSFSRTMELKPGEALSLTLQ
jgi:hypothetical protein